MVSSTSLGTYLLPKIIKGFKDVPSANDSHSSRSNPIALQLCMDNNIVVQTFVSHSSHLCQPLDRGIFEMFKQKLGQLRGNKCYKSQTEWNNALEDSSFAMTYSLRKMVVIKAWEKSGCWPVDEKKIVTEDNFPGYNCSFDEVTLPAKRKRNAFRIDNKILTSEAVIEALSEQKQNKLKKSKGNLNKVHKK